MKKRLFYTITLYLGFWDPEGYRQHHHRFSVHPANIPGGYLYLTYEERCLLGDAEAG